ncbi:MAG: hypothetical protein ACI8QF_004757 [Limisphaerales bacterium]
MQLTRVGLAWLDRLVPIPIDENVGINIQAQFGLTLALVRPVAEEAIGGKNRSNVTIEFDRLSSRFARDQQCEKRTQNERAPALP